MSEEFKPHTFKNEMGSWEKAEKEAEQNLKLRQDLAKTLGVLQKVYDALEQSNQRLFLSLPQYDTVFTDSPLSASKLARDTREYLAQIGCSLFRGIYYSKTKDFAKDFDTDIRPWVFKFKNK